MHGLAVFLIVAHILLLFLLIIGNAANISEAQAAAAIISALFIALIPPIIAYARNTASRNKVFLLSFCWLIPFSWIIALFMALFGKKELNDALPDTKKQHNRQHDTEYHETRYTYTESAPHAATQEQNIPANAIDRAFYKVGHGIKNTATTVRDSRVVRTTLSTIFKVAIIIGVFVGFVIVRILIEESRPQTYSSTYNKPYQTNTLKQTQSTMARPPQPAQQRSAPAQKSAEEIWFDRAAASMR